MKGEGSDACPADASQEVQNNPGNNQHEQSDGKGPFQPLAQRDTGDCQRTGSSAQGGGYQVGEAVAELECGNSQVTGHAQAFCHRLDDGDQDCHLCRSGRNEQVQEGDDCRHTHRGQTEGEFPQGQAGIVNDGVQDIAVFHNERHGAGQTDHSRNEGHAGGALGKGSADLIQVLSVDQAAEDRHGDLDSGHDGHTAMLLGAAKILKEHLDEVHGRIILFFERAEENGGGIPQMLAYMDEKGLKPDTVWGIHLYAGLESGKMGLLDGGTMASVFGFNVTIHGKGGHGSRPDQANSPIDCFVAIYNALEAARLTKITPFQPLTVSVGLLQAGAVGNVIPNDLTFAGTARFYDRDLVGMPFRNYFFQMVEGIAAAYGCTVSYNSITEPAFAVSNDPECAAFARKVIGEELGNDVIAFPEPWMASESFSQLQKLWPGVFALLGINNPEKGTGAAHHNEYFDLDEDVFKLGVAGAVTYALRFLDSDVDTSSRQWKGSVRDLFTELGIKPEVIDSYYKAIHE